MGCGGSTPAGDADPGGGATASKGDIKSRELDEQLEKQQKEENQIIKLLVLGTGESGKSTVFKQMKILYSVPDPPQKFIMICRANLFGNAKSVIEGMERLKIVFKTDEGKSASEKVMALPPDGNPDDIGSLVKPLQDLYADGGVQEAIDRAAEYQLNDSTKYFWERAEELCKADYLPSEQDVLRARVRTTGIVQQNFKIKDKKYTMFDVGGQRNERRKWIHCFDNVTAVIFVTAISEFDQVLYEDETTNRMDEALILFDQICNHPSFKKTSMILFLNKRDLFEMKLKKKDMGCWKPEAGALGQDYDTCLAYLKEQFLAKNKQPELRQVYAHATCATDTTNVSFVMESVFDVILKENLRKLATGDIDGLLEMASGSGVSGVAVGPSVYAEDKQGKIILAAAFYTEELAERKVLTSANVAELPGVQIGYGLSISETDWEWIMGLGKEVPDLPTFEAEAGSFRGDFKTALKELRKLLGESSLGVIYDTPITMANAKGARTTIICCVRKVSATAKPAAAYAGGQWVEHETFENACYKAFDAKDTDNSPCKPPDTSAEFNPFAANNVGFRWFKGITLYTKEVLKAPDTGVYLGVFKVLSVPGSFKVMVNEHNRTNIPMIFLTETQLTPEEMSWMQGVRCREEKFNIDLLEGKKPNLGWLGPEMSGEEGATFPEKLWWAIDEAKARMAIDEKGTIGKQYDKELLFTDEQDKIQLLLFGELAKDQEDCLPGHIWVDKSVFLRENMKFYCETTLKYNIGLIQDQVNSYHAAAAQAAESTSMEAAAKLRNMKDEKKKELKRLLEEAQPLKWVDRVIMWCADKMPSFTHGVDGGDASGIVKKAVDGAKDVAENAKKRDTLLKKAGVGK